MSNKKIRISVSDLRNQAAELSAIASDFENQYRTAVNTLHNMKDAMSLAMAVNMEVKSARMILYFSSLNITLQQGVTIANASADSFESIDRKNTDQIIRELFSNWLPEDVKSADVSQQKVTGCNNQRAIAKINELTDGEYHILGESYGINQDCYGYSKWVFNEMFGQAFSSQNYPNWRLVENSATTEIASSSGKDLSLESLSSIISQSESGDVLQVVWTYYDKGEIHQTPHTMILRDVIFSDKGIVTGFNTLEGNNPIGEYGQQHYYSIEDLYNRLLPHDDSYGGTGISVNHATNYDSIM